MSLIGMTIYLKIMDMVGEESLSPRWTRVFSVHQLGGLRLLHNDLVIFGVIDDRHALGFIGNKNRLITINFNHGR